MAKEDILVKARDVIADYEAWKEDPRSRKYFDAGSWMKIVAILRQQGHEINVARDVIPFIDDGTVNSLDVRVPGNDVFSLKNDILGGKYDNLMTFRDTI